MIEFPPKLAVNSHERRSGVLCQWRTSTCSSQGLHGAALLRGLRLAAAAWLAGLDSR